MISKKVCPNCGSTNVALIGSGPNSFKCKQCGFSGKGFIDKVFVEREGGRK